MNKTILKQSRFSLAVILFASALALAGMTPVSAYNGNGNQHQNEYHHNGHYYPYAYHNHHRGYWNESNGSRVFITIG